MKRNDVKPEMKRTRATRKKTIVLPRWLKVLVDWWNDLFYLFSGFTLILVGAGLLMWGLSALGYEKSKFSIAGHHIHVIDLCVYVYLALTLSYTAIKVKQWFKRKYRNWKTPKQLPGDDVTIPATAPKGYQTKQPGNERGFITASPPKEDKTNETIFP